MILPCHQTLVIIFLLLLVPTTHAALASTTKQSVEYVAGQRCLYVPCRGKDKASPPVVILGGMAQSIPSWEPQVPSFSQSRDVLLYEARGQGPARDNSENDNALFLQDVSLPAQAKYLMETLDELEDRMTDSKNDNQQQRQVDLVGFSLGGRIALAACLLYPHRIRKVHLTGVGADRSPLGHLTVESWKDHVQHNQGNLRSFAWSVLLATYSPATIQYWQPPQNRDYLETILHFVTKQNTAQGLTALLQQSHSSDIDNEWSTLSMARRFVSSSSTNHIQGHACVGQLDHDMAPVEQVERLCQELQWRNSCPTILPDCGHAAPMEQPRQWRQHVLEFLNS